MYQSFGFHWFFWGGLDLVHRILGPGPPLSAVLTTRTLRMGFLCQHGKEIGPKCKKRGRVDSQNAQDGVFVSTRQRTFANAVANDYLCALNYA